MSLDEILAVICIFQFAFTAIALFTHPKGKTISNFLLGTFFLAVAINFADGILILKRAYLNFPEFAFIGNSLSVTYGPLIFLYVQSIVYEDFKLKIFHLVHFIPLFLIGIITFFGFHLQSREMKLFILEQTANRVTPEPIYFISFIIIVLLVTYVIQSMRLLARYRNTLAFTYSSLDTRSLSWLNRFLILFLVSIGFSIIHSFLPLLGWEMAGEPVLLLIITTNFVLINIVLWKAVRQPDIFSGIKIPETKQNTPETESVSLPEIKKLGEEIRVAMIRERYYLESDLTLEQLSGKLGIKPRLLSHAINQYFNQNFFDFVNTLRIEEAKQLLLNPEDPKTTIQEVMYQVGFNSKSSFNTVFKKFTGLTPSEFRKKHKSGV